MLFRPTELVLALSVLLWTSAVLMLTNRDLSSCSSLVAWCTWNATPLLLTGKTCIHRRCVAIVSACILSGLKGLMNEIRFFGVNLASLTWGPPQNCLPASTLPTEKRMPRLVPLEEMVLSAEPSPQFSDLYRSSGGEGREGRWEGGRGGKRRRGRGKEE